MKDLASTVVFPKQVIEVDPNVNFKAHYKLTYKEMPNYVDAFMMPKHVLDQFLPIPSEH